MAIEFDPFACDIASSINELAITFFANLHIVEIGIVFVGVALDQHAFRSEHKHTLVGAGVDVAFAIDHNTSVGWPDRRSAVRSQAPSRDSIKGHDAASHSNRFGLVVSSQARGYGCPNQRNR